MHNLVFVRPAKPDDTKKFVDWSLETPDNEFDPEVVKYPSTFVLCAYDKDGALAYQPIQQAFIMDSFASRPGASKPQVATAMKELFQEAVTQAHLKGVGEIYFLGTEAGTNHMTTNQEVFEKLPWSVYRVKIRELEG
jgi:hypothetical protein